MSSSLNDANSATPIANTPALALFGDIADGGLVQAQALIEGEAASLIVHREGLNARAWLNVCPHAGRRLDWSPGKFLKSKDGLLVCAVHGASFDLTDGACIAGPCRGEHLCAVAVEVRDGVVVLAART